MTSPVDIDALLVALAERVLGLARSSRMFSTKRGEAPDGYSRDAWRKVARTIGVKRGRHYFVTQAQLDAYEGTSAPAAPSTSTAAWSPADAARDLGLRLVGGGR